MALGILYPATVPQLFRPQPPTRRFISGVRTSRSTHSSPSSLRPWHCRPRAAREVDAEEVGEGVEQPDDYHGASEEFF
eukprot:7721077-Lingulodinium_polyedra.AAC.1